MIGYHTKSCSNVNWSVGNIDGKIYTKMRACGGKKKMVLSSYRIPPHGQRGRSVAQGIFDVQLTNFIASKTISQK
jgi:hypothetical protein